ncbi:hypothetical protein FKP32DRAFT_290697 [Trametes sanguinea]|nr:hypothetical protein FKP32DRAFT_290697 [Trametes sanguinea]
MLTPTRAGIRTLPLDSMCDSSTAAETQTVDIIPQFLVEQGLSISFARALRNVGIIDRSRICTLGALPDADLARLETRLESEGLDFVACLLVRAGLRSQTILARIMSVPAPGILRTVAFGSYAIRRSSLLSACESDTSSLSPTYCG